MIDQRTSFNVVLSESLPKPAKKPKVKPATPRLAGMVGTSSEHNGRTRSSLRIKRPERAPKEIPAKKSKPDAETVRKWAEAAAKEKREAGKKKAPAWYLL